MTDEVRTVEPSDDVDRAPEAWQVIGRVAIGFVLFGIAAFFALMFITGFWVWSLLI